MSGLPQTALRITNVCPDKAPAFDVQLTMTDATTVKISPGTSEIVPISGGQTITAVAILTTSSGAPKDVQQHVDIG